jgi:arylsulfatase A-like enzyme
MWAWLAACHANRCPVPADPGAPAATIEHGRGLWVDAPTSLRDLHARVSPARTPVRWEVDGVDAGIAGLTVPARVLVPRQRWEAVATIDGAEVRASVVVPDPPGGNVLVLVLDDVGVDKVRAYGHPTAPPTPTLDALAAEGVRFDRAYASPVCSPTRGVLLTGRHARRSGLGWIVDTGDADYGLPLAALTIPEALDDARTGPWATSAVGKWHLAPKGFPDHLRHPLDQGFDWYAGAIGNPSYREDRGYFAWDKDVNGVVEPSSTYMTTDTADDAIARAGEMPEPWFLYVAFNAVHTPLAPPPPELTGLTVDDDAPTEVLYDATLEALDREVGRLLAGLDPAVRARTTIVALGDNGTSPEGIDPPLDPRRAKETPYELGIHVPLLIAGPHVAEPGSVSRAMVHVADLMPTVAELAGIPLTGPDDALALDLSPPVPLDGRSLLPLLADPRAPGHDRVYTEGFFPNGPADDRDIDRRTLRDERYKLVRLVEGPDELYDLSGDPLDDGPNLLEHPTEAARRAAKRLAAELDCLEAELSYVGW